MKKYTPGPWRWLNRSTLVADHGSRRVILVASSRNHIPTLSGAGEDGLLEELRGDGPNALLLAASPDLLEACIQLLKEFKGHIQGQESHYPGVTQAISAIAKATGEK